MKKHSAVLAASLLLAAGVVYAQLATAPPRGPIAQNDAVQVVPNGAPSAQSVYSSPGAIAGVDEYSYQIPLTAFTITPANGVSYLLLNPAGTLATGTLTMEAQPSDGQRFTVFTSQTQTAITISANTGQTMDAGVIGLAQPTALTAKTSYTWRYIASIATWVRTA